MNVGHCPILPIQLGMTSQEGRPPSRISIFQLCFFVRSLPKALVHSNGCGIRVPSWPFWDPTTEASNWRHLPWTWRIPWWEGWIHSRKLTKKWRFGRCLSSSGSMLFFWGCVREASCIKKRKEFAYCFFYCTCIYALCFRDRRKNETEFGWSDMANKFTTYQNTCK